MRTRTTIRKLHVKKMCFLHLKTLTFIAFLLSSFKIIPVLNGSGRTASVFPSKVALNYSWPWETIHVFVSGVVAVNVSMCYSNSVVQGYIYTSSGQNIFF